MIQKYDCEVVSPVGAGKNTISRKCTDEKKRQEENRNSTYENRLKRKYIYKSKKTKISKRKKRKQPKSKTFGDCLVEKETGVIRIVSQNVNCIGVNSENNYKQERAKNWIYDHEVDIIGWQEVGVAFHTLPRHERLAERMKDLRWDKFRISSSNNKHEKINKMQYGGTAVMSFNESSHRVKVTGGDPTGLGRWSWIVFEGKAGHKTRVISAYIPCKSADDKRKTVYMQHKRYFLRKGIMECPKKLLYQHLSNHLKKWQKEGENIVLLIDMNENLEKDGPFQTILKYECQLVDPIRTIHQKRNEKLPPTSLTGSFPIDSIFVSPQLQNITRGGWIKIEDSVGDHRALFIDLPTKTLLGEEPFQIHKHTARRLVCDKPSIVDKFNHLLDRQFHLQRIYYKYELLIEEHKNGNSSRELIHRKLDKLDCAITNAIRHAEKRCRKVKTGNVPYSPKLSEAGKVINLWNNVIRKKKGCNISSTYIKRLAKKVGIPSPMMLTLHDAEFERKIAYNEYKKIKKNAKESRDQFIHEIASQQAARGNESVSGAIRRILRNEEIRASYRRIKSVTKPFFGTTERILIKEEDGTERTTTSKDEIEEALCIENRKKFTQAYSSPFLQKPLIQQLGQTATNERAREILRGSFNSKIKIHKDTMKFIQHMAKPQSVQNQDPNDESCSIETAAYYWKKKREKTNSSMSQRHIGTYKAMTHDLRLLKVVNNVANIAFRIGLPLTRWTKDLDVSLLKKPNKIRPSELRTIGTLEADFNQQASLHFSKRMMNNGLTHKIIPSSQYAKKGHQSIEAAIIKIMFFDYLRIMKRNGAFIAMDLMNCFDRMAHPVSSLCAQRLGTSSTVSECMINTLCRMQHYIRTAYGDSEWSYTGSSRRPLQGAVQGNGAASPLFIAISCVIISFLEAQVVGFVVKSAITLTTLNIIAIMYVDDSDILIGSTSATESERTIRNRVQHAADIYHKGVYQTGGAIRPDKCRWFLITFEWKAGKWRYGKNTEIDDIYIKDTHNKYQKVKRLSVSEGWKGLGVIAAPDGNWNDQVEFLVEEKIKPWNNSIQNSLLQKHDVYRSAFTSIFKTVEYPLAATYMSKRQCKYINTHLHKKFLSKIGINGHLPLAYRYAPKRFQGLGSFEVESKQFIKKLKTFLWHASTKSQLGDFIKLTIESQQLLIGTNHHLFSISFEKYGCLAETSWITELWRTSNEYDIQIRGFYERTQPCRENDFALMDKLIEADSYTDEDLQSINRCRLYLQVQNMSDIANGIGNKISYCAIHHIRDPENRSKYEWPNQTIPPKSDWEVWNDAVANIWGDEQNRIQPPLGKWIKIPKRYFQWTLEPKESLLYHKVSTMSYNIYINEKKRKGRHTADSYKYFKSTSTLPTGTIPAIVNRIQPNNIVLESTIQDTDEDIYPSEAYAHMELFFKQINFPQDSRNLKKHIQEGTAVAVTDASVSKQTLVAASSFIITTPELNDACVGSHGVPTGSSEMESYRAELYGVFSIVMTLTSIVRKYNITEGSITLACDNKASLFNSILHQQRSNINQSSFDILWAIHDLLQTLPIKIVPKHVLGHQDLKKKKLSLLETLNCFVDRKASQYRHYIENSNTYKYSKVHWLSNWVCRIDGKYITSEMDRHVLNKINESRMRQYLVEKKKYHPRAFDLINWDAIQSATESLPHSKQLWLTKHVSGFCGVAVKMNECKKWESPLCPICQKQNENTKHIITCADNRCRNKYQDELKQFVMNLEKIETHPSILQILHSSLQQQKNTYFTQHIPTHESDIDIRLAAADQDCIGWHNFFKGHIATKWSNVQYEYYKKIRLSPPSYNFWAQNVISFIYKFTQNMWKHRNKLVYEKVEENLDYQQLQKLHSDITQQYMLGEKTVMNCHSYMFEECLNNIFDLSVTEKKLWLETIIASRTCYEIQNRQGDVNDE